MTGATVMMMRVFVAVMATRLATLVLVVRVATPVQRDDFMLVRGLARSRLPCEGRRQHGHQQDGDQELGNGSQGAAHRRIVPERRGFGYVSDHDCQ